MPVLRLGVPVAPSEPSLPYVPVGIASYAVDAVGAVLQLESRAEIYNDIVATEPFPLVEAVPESFIDYLPEARHRTPSAMGTERISRDILDAPPSRSVV